MPVGQHRPTLAEFQHNLGLDGKPEIFESLKALVKKMTKELLPPQKETSHEEKLEGINEIAHRIAELHQDVLLGEANSSRRKALRHMISRERINRKVYYNLMHKKTSYKLQDHTKIIRSSSCEDDSAFKSDTEKVIDLTISDTELTYATESDPGSKNDGSYELQLDSLLGPGILTRSQARRERNTASVGTSGSIFTSASISGASSLSAQGVTPVPASSLNSSPPPDVIRQFLSRCRPNMEYLLPCFHQLAVQTSEDLNSIGKWSAAQRRSFFGRMRPENNGDLLTELHLTAIEHQFVSRNNSQEISRMPLHPMIGLNLKRSGAQQPFGQVEGDGERPAKKRRTALKDRWVMEVGPNRYVDNENQPVNRDGKLLS